MDNLIIRIGSKPLLLIALFLSFSGIASSSSNQMQLDAAKNYLFILVPSRGNTSGIFDGRQNLPVIGGTFSHLKQYLETELDLKGYVYSYDFSNKEDTVEHWGWELGDRNYDNPSAVSDRNTISNEEDRPHKVTRKSGRGGLSWLEQAREDFKVWYADSINEC